MDTADTLQPRTRIPEFDKFRGMAILLIMLGHGFSGLQGSHVAYLKMLIGGNTALFVFISGFFLHYIYLEKYNYIEFLKNRTRYIFIPFLTITCCMILLNVTKESLFKEESVIDAFVETLSFIYDRGYYDGAHWYVTFILLLFLFRPLHSAYAALSGRMMTIILLAMLIITCLGHRPTDNIDKLHAVGYYTFYYLFGIYYSKYREKINQYKVKISAVCIPIIAISIYVSVYMNQKIGKYEKTEFFSYSGWDWFALQKAALCLPLLFLFANEKNTITSRALCWMASLSFGLYFLHGPLQQLTRKLISKLPILEADTVLHSFAECSLIFTVGFIASLLIIFACRALFGAKNSRVLIGS